MPIAKSSSGAVQSLNGGCFSKVTVELELNFWKKWRGSFHSGAASVSIEQQAAPGSTVEGRHKAISAMGLPAGLKTWGRAT